MEPLRLFGSLHDIKNARDILSNSGWRVDMDMRDCALQTSWAGEQVEQGLQGGRAWRASEFLFDVLPTTTNALAQVPLPLRPVAIDVGCGSGRDAVFLALELGPQWEVVAVDNHKGALQRAADLAKREGVQITCVDRDLRRKGLTDMKAHLVHGSRFLERGLFPEVRDSVLLPGGVLIWSHFLNGGEHLAPPRRPSRQLLRGELRETFIEAGEFHSLQDVEGTMTTRFQDVPAAFFAAQKPF
eukprot:CAMPEP_0196574968 /NCGR_PEP_ID=MMETSP1081-20130531/4555_1 /TAXON_ID=36882 /ORGANISM="Pyramimonas amylifera, Strain CCMP720" /LENGTH=241 /DNA_ID=CAMNT_0041893133 /DNA_START=328 /DNA_END=1053 /DNA_ORIENTATION=+